MVAPSSNSLFDVARQAPESDEQWAAVRNSAVLLAESGNLLLMGKRSNDTDVLEGDIASASRAGRSRPKEPPKQETRQQSSKPAI